MSTASAMETRGSEKDLSILIATRNRAASLTRSLDALAAQNLDGLSWEVVVIDNGSSDATPGVLARAAKSLPLVPLSEPSPGKNIALNRALDIARGRLFVFTDDDVIPDCSWAATLHRASLRWPEDSIFGGAIQPRFPASTPRWLSGDAFPYGRWAFGRCAPRADEGPTDQTPLGSNLAILRRAFRDTRFDESMGPRGSDYPMGSEVDFLMRLYRQGEQFIFVPSAKVEHVLAEQATSRSHLTGRAYRCGRGNARLFPEPGSFPLFGIPLYTVRQSLRALAVAVVSPLRGERDRCVALLTLHQLRGELTERRRMLAALGARVGRFPGRDAFRRAIQSRGLLGVALAPIRWAVKPLVQYNLYQFFEWTLAQRLPKLPNAPGVRVTILRGIEHSRAVRVALCPLGHLKPEKIDHRLARGDSVAIAWAENRAVGFAWNAYTDLPMPEIEATIRVASSDIVGYDGWVSPGWRGHGILPQLDAVLIEEAAGCGRVRQLISTNTRNKSIARSLRAAGKRKLFKVAYVRFPLLGWEWKRAFGAPYPALFRNSLPHSEPQSARA